MPITRASHRRLPLGIILYGNKIWLSELLAITATWVLLLFFIAIGFEILLNSLTLRRYDRQIAAFKIEKIVVDHTLAEMRREASIVSLLRELAGEKVPDHTLSQVANSIRRNSDQFGYDPLLLVAVISVESVFDPKALGRFRSGTLSGAFGLMQLKFETAAEIAAQLHLPVLTKKDLFDPEINLVLGVAYLTSLISQFRSFKLGLLAYNQGPGVIHETLSNREPLSIGYYQKVLKSFYYLRKLAAKLESEKESNRG